MTPVTTILIPRGMLRHALLLASMVQLTKFLTSLKNNSCGTLFKYICIKRNKNNCNIMNRKITSSYTVIGSNLLHMKPETVHAT